MRSLELGTSISLESDSAAAPRRIDATAEERDLVRRMRAGDEGAFDDFANHYIPALYRFAAARLRGNREVVRDVVQSTVCKAIERLGTYRGEAPLFTWLCACCRNEIAGYYRRQNGAPGAVSSEQADALLFNAVTPEDLALESESANLVHLALDHLPPRYAAALQWKYIEGLSVNEIAGRLNVGEKAAESILSRARAQFRSVYERLTAVEVST